MYQDRLHERKDVALPSSIRRSEDAPPGADCEILDLSVGGAKLKLATAIPAETAVHLGLGNIGEFAVTLAWSRPPLAGIYFKDGPEVMNDVIIAVALYGTCGKI